MRTPSQAFLSLFIFCSTLGSMSMPVWAESTETQAHDSQHAAPHNLNWPGLYHGFTPCADCVGVKTTLALNTNNTYILMTQNVGKSNREFVEKGKFSWGEKKNTVILTPRKSETSHYYIVGENTLTQLDEKGEAYSGKEAERYILRRTDVTTPIQLQHGGH